MSIKIVLNGAGRIGKSILKQLLNDENFEIVAINEINPSVENEKEKERGKEGRRKEERANKR